MFENTKAIIDSYIEAGIPGGDILIKKDGKEILRYIAGYRDIEKTVPMDGTERYNIYSCSKMITCVCALKLWEEGKFRLSDPVSLYLPEFAELYVKTENGIEKAKNTLTIEHLFTMSGGYDYNFEIPQVYEMREKTGGRCPTREAVRAFAKIPLLFEPGTKWLYGICHDILACLVEVISGVRFADYVMQNIFVPLGMKNSTFLLPENELATICPQYFKEGDKLKRVSADTQGFKLGEDYDSGGAGCISTVEDYMLFLEALRKGEILKSETLDMMCVNRFTSDEINVSELEATLNGRGYGLGVRCKYDENDPYDDFGWGGAAGAYFSCDRTRNLCIYFGMHVLNHGLNRTKILGAVLKDLGYC